MKFVPHPYQRHGISWLVQRPEAALFYEPGLGKTAITLAAFQALRRAGAVRKALVVAPLRVAYQVWSAVGEIGKWDDFADLRVALLHGPKKEQALAQDADLYVVNYDGLPWLAERGGFTALLKAGVDLLILDELSRLKHPRTQRCKVLKPWLGRFKRRWGLTGTPVANGLLDLFGQVYVLDLGRTLGRFITHYRNRYFSPTGYGGYTWVPRPDAERDIYAALKPLASSLKAADCLDLPDLVEEEMWVELPAPARAAYAALEKDLIAVINDKTVTAANVAVAVGKCRQVVSGAIYTSTDGKSWTAIHDAKLDAVGELIGELQGAPLLIAYEYRHELARLREKFGDVPALNGDITATETAQLIAAWNDRQLPILCAHPAAAGHGLNLQRGGSHLCWLTLPWDLELYDQTIHRLWRQGSHAACVIVHKVLARSTVDQIVAGALARKERGQDALFAALRRRPKSAVV